MKFLQQIGKSLMLPIASLPVAAILLRVGVMLSHDLHNVPEFLISTGQIIQFAGQALFDNLGIIFAVGIAIGFSKDQHGSAALAGLIGYLVMFSVMGAFFKILNPHDLANQDLSKVTSLAKYKEISTAQVTGYSIPAFKMTNFGGASILPAIIIGVIAGLTYNKFKDVRLPQALSFFGGKRLVPLLTSIFAIFVGLFFAWTMKWFSLGVSNVATWINNTKPFGFFVYGLLNRLLIPTGLHHVMNTFFWFTTGHCSNNPSLQGDITMFLNHCSAAKGFSTPGSFQTGFFPVMMFGLPGAALAIAHCAKPENKKKIYGVMGGVAAVSFLTGVTEPIEFAFMFASPVLFVLHAILTGLSHLITNSLHMYHGFGFSAGFTDYILNFNIATNPLWLLVVGLGMFVTYYVSFRFIITKFNVLTPGRENNNTNTNEINTNIKDDQKASMYYEALGGFNNIIEINNCTTRLRLVLKATNLVNKDQVKEIGAMGQIQISNTEYQIIIGPEVEFIADAMRNLHTSKINK